MANRLCWKCDSKAHMTKLGTQVFAKEPVADGRMLQSAFQCDECEYLSVGMSPWRASSPGASPSSNWLDDHDPTWYPIYGERTEYPDVPQHIGEAHLCHSVGAYRAAVLLARSVIEATAKDKGITTGRLVTKDRRDEQGRTDPKGGQGRRTRSAAPWQRHGPR